MPKSQETQSPPAKAKTVQKSQHKFLSPKRLAIAAAVVLIVTGSSFGVFLWQNTAQNLTRLQAQLAESQQKIAMLETKKPLDVTPVIDALRAELAEKLNQLSDKIAAQAKQSNANLRQFDLLQQQLSNADENGQITITAAQDEIAALRTELNQLGQRLLELESQSAARPAPHIVVQHIEQLKASFTRAAHRAIRAEHLAKAQELQGGTQKFMAWLRSQFSIRSIVPKAGNSADAILSRVQVALEQGNLAEAMVQIDMLSPAAHAALADWRAELEKHLKMTQESAS